MASFQQLLDNLDADPLVRGKQFEHICKWYLQHEPYCRNELDKVWLWDEWDDGPDHGIDLVAKTKSGDLWAIQAKAYDPEKNLAKSHVDSFLANSARSEFTFRLILTTSADLSGNLWKQLAKIEPRASAKVLSDLHAAKLDWPESPAALRAKQPDPKKPFDYQKEAIRDVVDGFKTSDRGQLIMACGTGKTLVGLWVAERLKSERTLVLLPSLSLLSQVMEEWLLNGKRRTRVLAVCSDKSVTKGADEWVTSTSELGFPVTTDPEAIASELEQPGPILVFSTYHSSPQIAEAQRLTEASFDLAVADEAHRCAGRVSSDFATILDSDEIRADKRLFMTATPRYFTSQAKGVARSYEHELASMDDEGRFGSVFHKLSFSEAIERDLLSPYRLVVIGVDDRTFKDYAEHGRLVTLDGKEITDARYLASQVALAKAMRKYDLRRTLTFHSRVPWAKEFAEDFSGVVARMPKDERPQGDLWCEHVSGKMPTSIRRKRLKVLRELGPGERGLLSNAQCLGEGIDVPTLDGVAFIDPKRSPVTIIQAVGRAIRKAPDKQYGTIIVPVFVESHDDPEVALSSSAFEPLWEVIKALRAQDDELADWLDHERVRIDWGRLDRHRPGLPDSISIELPTWIGESFTKAFYLRTVCETSARPDLTVEQILLWADAHHERTGTWPNLNTGPVHQIPNETWRNVHSSLYKGFRGLPGGISLANFLFEERGVAHHLKSPKLTADVILRWADAHHARTDTWPTQTSGPIPECPGENWSKVHNALYNGTRGLPGGSSLARLLSSERGVRNIKDLEDLAVETIIGWADAYKSHTGNWPKVDSGPIPGTTETWTTVNRALSQGIRGLKGESSLATLLAERRNVRHHKNLPVYTVAGILEWADAHHARTGKWPTERSGRIPEAPDETWHKVESALRQGVRGLTGGSSLAGLLHESRGVRNLRHLPDLTVDDILSWADAFKYRTGKWPAVLSGAIPEAPGETWNAVHLALRSGRRGLPGGSSLAKFLKVLRGVRNPRDLEPFTIARILRWADNFRARTGGWPKASSGRIAGHPEESWSKVDQALHRGRRGLPGGSSLAQLLAEHRSVAARMNPPELSIERLLEWVDAYRRRTGEWPMRTSGQIPEAPGETWSRVNNALYRGQRGLPGGSSLATLLDEHRRKKE